MASCSPPYTTRNMFISDRFFPQKNFHKNFSKKWRIIQTVNYFIGKFTFLTNYTDGMGIRWKPKFPKTKDDNPSHLNHLVFFFAFFSPSYPISVVDGYHTTRPSRIAYHTLITLSQWHPVGGDKVAVAASSIAIHGGKFVVWRPFWLHKVACFPFQHSFIHNLLLMLTFAVVRKGFSFFLSIFVFVYILFPLYVSVSFQNNQMHCYWIRFWVS